LETITRNEGQLNNFMQNLINIRRYYGISKKRMAQLLGISLPSLNQLETLSLPGRLSVEVLVRMCRQFRLAPDALFEGILADFQAE